ncbi:MAG: dephospho-CoA kinase [Actinomycetota bacterium]|nr:dephospho-CoA kinase [Actinomycetota bacterium]
MAPRPAFIGLTGAIGSGKTEALRALERLGAATLSTDEVAHEALGDPDVVARLVERWGAGVANGGLVDRKAVGEIVFADRDELRWIESITHPKVAERVVDWQTGLGEELELAVVEVPLLFEASMEAFFDGVLVVVAGDRRAGWLEARGDAGVEGRTGRQMAEEEKSERATWVVSNDGTLEDLEKKLREIWPQLVEAGRER